MLTDNINLDKLLHDIDQQIEIVSGISRDNPLLQEQLRLLHEASGVISNLQQEIFRLEDMIDPDTVLESLTISEKLNEIGDL